MILLLGGTSETAPLAEALASAGHRVLVSTATEVPLRVGDHPRISRRAGPLDEGAMAALVAEKDVRAIVDASHPYATQASANAKAVAEERGIPCLRWLRPAVLSRSGAVCRAADHPSAARLAFSFGRPVLLTTGSRNLAPYARESSRTGISLVVRVLSHPESIAACERFGIPHERVLTGRGPFSMEDNLTVIRAFDIGVVVTKDSGAAGGVAEKLEAAAQENCRVVVVERPAVPSGAEIHDVEELVRTLGEALTKDGPGVP